MIENFNIKERINSVQIITYLLGLSMILIILCKDQFFNVGNYFILPISIVIIGCTELVTYMIKNKRIVDLKISDYSIIFILVYVVFSSLVLRLPSKFDSVMSYGLLFLLLLVCSLTKFNKKQVIFILKCYIASALILCIIIFIQRKTPYPGVMRYSIFFSETGFFDVNFLAAYIGIPTLFSFNNAMLRKDKNGKIVYLLITAILLLGVFLTGSRGGLVGVVIGALFTICTRSDFRHKIFKKPKLKTVLITLFIIVIIFLLLPKELTERFFMQSYNDGSNQKRIQHWIYSIQAFIHQPIFGCGITWTIEVIQQYCGANYTSHNTFLGALMQLGIVGMIPFMIILLNPIKEFWKIKDTGLVGIIIALLFMLIMIEAQSSLILFVPLIVIYIILRYSVNYDTDIIL